ncbi:S1C family serine protease [Roseomonas sp. CECT 9278]|uniref:S1C family serine protease n=1 Tax=Roseomonas sp. CECT 9278 TaxID=2845823 RepID=UPI001E4B8A1B|nr:serine protease [Roseomonas sp. CECT 9278]CAH0152014.1 hypothetical protein ROS9278_00740 [Roseomonas sp. CECT 9278]
MRRFLLMAAGLALVAAMPPAARAQPRPAAPPAAQPAHPDPDFTLINASGRSVFFIRIRPAGSTDWGEDLLGSGVVLRDGARFLVRPPRDGRCSWDVQVQFDNSVERIFPATPVCRLAHQTISPEMAASSGSTAIVLPGATATPPAAAAQAPPASPAAPTPRLRVTNGWSVTLLNLALRPPGRPDSDANWGADLLGIETVLPRESLAVRLPEGTPCRVDIRTGFDMGNTPLVILTRNVDLCAGGEFAANGPPRGQLLGTGSGFFVTRAGHIATNQHVVHGCGSMVVMRPDGQTIRLRVLQNDPRNDLALLQLPEARTPAVTFRDPLRPMRQGEALLAMGYPLGARLGNQVTISTGILTALRGARGSENRFTLSAPLNGGNSGGPIYDDAGLVVGVAVSVSTGNVQSVNFGVPARLLIELLASANITPETTAPREPIKPADVFERNAPMVMQLGCIS